MLKRDVTFVNEAAGKLATYRVCASPLPLFGNGSGVASIFTLEHDFDWDHKHHAVRDGGAAGAMREAMQYLESLHPSADGWERTITDL